MKFVPDMKTTRVRFQSFENLAAFLKLFNKESFIINIQALTLTAPLSNAEVAMAVDQFDANVQR